MNPFAIAAAAKAGSSILSHIFGKKAGDAPQLPPYLEKLILEYVNQKNYSGFLPDKEAYDRSLRAKLDEINATLPISTEAFNADLAARGLIGSGEAPGRYHTDVIAPVARAEYSVAAESELGFAKAFQQGSIAANQARMNALNLLYQFHATNLNYKYNSFMADAQGQGQFLNDLFSAGTDFLDWNAVQKTFDFGGGGGGTGWQ